MLSNAHPSCASAAPARGRPASRAVGPRARLPKPASVRVAGMISTSTPSTESADRKPRRTLTGALRAPPVPSAANALRTTTSAANDYEARTRGASVVARAASHSPEGVGDVEESLEKIREALRVNNEQLNTKLLEYKALVEAMDDQERGYQDDLARLEAQANHQAEVQRAAAMQAEVVGRMNASLAHSHIRRMESPAKQQVQETTTKWVEWEMGQQTARLRRLERTSANVAAQRLAEATETADRIETLLECKRRYGGNAERVQRLQSELDNRRHQISALNLALDVVRDDLHSPTWLNTNAMVEAALVELGGTIKVERDLRQRGLRPVTIKMGEAGPTPFDPPAPEPGTEVPAPPQQAPHVVPRKHLMPRMESAPRTEPAAEAAAEEATKEVYEVKLDVSGMRAHGMVPNTIPIGGAPPTPFDPPKPEPVIDTSGMRARGMVPKTIPIGQAPPTPFDPPEPEAGTEASTSTEVTSETESTAEDVEEAVYEVNIDVSRMRVHGMVPRTIPIGKAPPTPFDPPKLEPVIPLSGMRARGMVLRTVPIGDAPPTPFDPAPEAQETAASAVLVDAPELSAQVESEAEADKAEEAAAAAPKGFGTAKAEQGDGKGSGRKNKGKKPKRKQKKR